MQASNIVAAAAAAAHGGRGRMPDGLILNGGLGTRPPIQTVDCSGAHMQCKGPSGAGRGRGGGFSGNCYLPMVRT